MAEDKQNLAQANAQLRALLVTQKELFAAEVARLQAATEETQQLVEESARKEDELRDQLDQKLRKLRAEKNEELRLLREELQETKTENELLHQ